MIRSEHQQVVIKGDRANEEVCMRTLYAVLAAYVEIFRSSFMVFGGDRKILKDAQVRFQFIKKQPCPVCLTAVPDAQVLSSRPVIP